MASGLGVHTLTLLREFRPFGLTVEEADGETHENRPEDYQYSLFNPQITRDPRFLAENSVTSASCDQSDHEIFIRGNRLIWSAGSRVHKRYTSPTSIAMACWCRMDSISEPLLCVLQDDSLTIHSPSGEVVSVPLPFAVVSIWSSAFGLLLQRSIDDSLPSCPTFSSYSPLLNARDSFRLNRESGVGPQYNLSVHGSSGHNFIGDISTMSSHFILKHPLEEPQAIFVEERGKSCIMNDLEESIIWTSDAIPVIATYHKGKMQHSVWRVDIVDASVTIASSLLVKDFVVEEQSKAYCLHKIWQGRSAQPVASKVFLATDVDEVPLICFVFQEQKGLFFIRLQTGARHKEILYDMKPDMNWTIPAIAALPVVVTRPRIKDGWLQLSDVLVLSTENNLLLYSGRQCLCKYLLPTGIGRVSHDVKPLPSDVVREFKITGLGDAVGGRINIIISGGQMFRCSLRNYPMSSLANDCITALAEGLHPSFYHHFVVMLWGNGGSSCLSSAESSTDSEWESLVSVILGMCKQLDFFPQSQSDTTRPSSWEFLLNSKYHLNYCRSNFITGIPVAWGHKQMESHCPMGNSTAEQSREKAFYAQILTETLDSLHAVYENYKLDNLRKWDLELLVVLLRNIAASLGESNYVDHYVRDFPSLLSNARSSNSLASPQTPPSVFRWLESCLKHGCDSGNKDDLPPLVYRDGSVAISWLRKIVSFYSLLLGTGRTGRKLGSGVYCNVSSGSAHSPEELTVLAMVAEGFGSQQLDLLPAGVSLPLRHALDRCRESPPVDWPAAAYVLVGREDLAMTCFGHKPPSGQSLVSLSSPYMLHVRPVTVPSSIFDASALDGNTVENTDSLDGSAADGMEQIFNSSTHLRFGRDLRLNEVRRLLCSARPVAVQTPVNPSASDQDLQQAQLWQLAQRTTALPLGRGAFTLATTSTLLTEALVVPKLNLAGRLPSQQNATVNLDPNIRNIQELRSWPEFHNGVAAGLKLAPFQGKMSRAWISYNKREEPSVTHAGLLVALGLLGHLRVLTMTDVYKYLSQEHDMTTVGVLLGMAAAHRGTMLPYISKMIYVHIPSRHPASFPELEFATLLQSAALMSVGLLYEGSAHPLTMKILLGEIGRRTAGDNVLEREGYAVAAGSALGLVGLGRGNDFIGYMDTLVDRLFQYILGGKDLRNERSAKFAPMTEDLNRSTGQMMDGTQVNVDVTAPGATIALALLFLKTESDVVASKLSVPVTFFDLQFVRPDFLLLRVIARNLILWSRVCPSKDWIEGQIPEIVKKGLMTIEDDTSDFDDLDVEALVQAYVNILAGACVSLGLRYAGTKNGHAQELLNHYAVFFLNEIKPIPAMSRNIKHKGLMQYVDRGTLETCLHIVVLSLSVVMAGSGHIQTFRLLRYLRGRNSVDGHINYGSQMAVSMAIGFLFLGGGMRTFSTGNNAIAALLISLYPRLPTGPNDNRCHLQVFRHFYVLATEARCVQTVDVDTGLTVYAPLEMTIKETEHHAETNFSEVTPCILPERAILKSVRVCGPRYWPQKIELITEEKPWWVAGDPDDPFNGGLLYVKRKVGACSYVDDPIGCQSLLSRVMHKVCDTSGHSESATSVRGNSEPGPFKVDQLVSTFSADPSLIAFAQLCCGYSWNNRSDADFREFCIQVLFECVSKDRPALLQTYLGLYTIIGIISEQVKSCEVIFKDTIFLSSLKLALAYNDALVVGRLGCPRGDLIQRIFLAAIGKRVEETLKHWQGQIGEPFSHLLEYLGKGNWPLMQPQHAIRDSLLLSCYLQWFNVPPSFVVKSSLGNIGSEILLAESPVHNVSLPLLRFMFPDTHIYALGEISRLLT
ncbi:anaphase-promoting complex subunit 1 isoform X1 [Amborella trichopoda]|uniref:Anaphase-promoting complex subunit 1 n=2 Tax=Amborella trichopoda TaxID=13333 RepID=W1PE19_AMBTC|nr:anaphase-promoting complex subunit 1 isoform X1 [Amborella trichopoda]XP_020522345.1 anaphase-promoting complex subunit 1 isoform X1 [Amborella trichopoda]ERN05300.1 hypothetical protein AMTR_s00007p00148280 [Amborella trichopoda]|eukprot:XP_006843625.1 anaphase-promoting complex subunit 1 isoform X1 [Amborella trichopoda]